MCAPHQIINGRPLMSDPLFTNLYGSFHLLLPHGDSHADSAHLITYTVFYKECILHLAPQIS